MRVRGNIALLIALSALILSVQGSLDVRVPNPLGNTQQCSVGSPLTTGTVNCQGLTFATLNPTSTGSSLSAELSVSVSESLRSCEWDYYRIDLSTITNREDADYLHLEVRWKVTLNVDNTFSNEKLYWFVKYSNSSVEGFPTIDDYDWKLITSVFVDDTTNTDETYAQTFFELPSLGFQKTGYYWVGVTYDDHDAANYNMFASVRKPLAQCTGSSCTLTPSITPLTLDVPTSQLNDYRPDPDNWNDEWEADDEVSNLAQQNLVREWRYFSYTPSSTNTPIGAYLVFNISNIYADNYHVIEYNTTFANNLNFYLKAKIPPYIVGTELDGQTNQQDKTPAQIWDASTTSIPFTISCTSTPYCGDGFDAFPSGHNDPDYHLAQYTCALVVSPCDVVIGTTYYLGFKMTGTVTTDDFTTNYFTSYNITVSAPAPVVTSITVSDTIISGVTSIPNYRFATNLLATPFKTGFIDIARQTHYTFIISANAIDSYTNLLLELWSISGTNQLYVRRQIEDPTVYPGRQLAGAQAAVTPPSSITKNTGCANCYPSGLSCSSCAYCQVRYAPCNLNAGTYYLSIVPSTAAALNEYDFRVSLFQDPSPVSFAAGDAQHGIIGYGEYAFFVLDVPATTHTTLYVELFANAVDQPLVLRVSYFEPAGEECYVDGDWYCKTTTDTTSSLSPLHSCYFMIDECKLVEGPLYFSVYAPNANTVSRYAQDVHFTLWAEFETPWELVQNITYTEVLHADQYNHYFVNTEALAGSWFTVELDNVQAPVATPITFNAYLNYEDLAGECPCYTNLFNCSTITPPTSCADTCPYGRSYLAKQPDIGQIKYNNNAGSTDASTTAHTCKLEVDACSFRSGRWYIGVRAITPNTDNYSPIVMGYTLTAIVHPPPPVYTLRIDNPDPVVGWVSENNHNHYLLEQLPVAGSNLVLRLTWMLDDAQRYQTGSKFNDNANPTDKPHFLTDSNNKGDSLQLRLKGGNLALKECYDVPWSCTANSASFSSCTLVIPYCEWLALDQHTFVSVYFNSPTYYAFNAQYTLSATIAEDDVVLLTPGEPVYAKLTQNRYAHYHYLVDPAELEGKRVDVSIYYNADRNYDSRVPTFSFLKDAFAGDSRGCDQCYSNAFLFQCKSPFACEWTFDPCTIADIGKGQWYFSVYSGYKDFYDLPLEYTLTLSFPDAVKQLGAFSTRANPTDSIFIHDESQFWIRRPVTSSSLSKYYPSIRHFNFTLPSDISTANNIDYLTISLKSKLDLDLYLNPGSLAGIDCDCYDHDWKLSTATTTDCTLAISTNTLRIPACQLIPGGNYYIAVYAHTQTTGDFDAPSYFLLDIVLHRTPIFAKSPSDTFGGSSTQFSIGHAELFQLEDDTDNWFLPSTWSDNNVFRNQRGYLNDMIHYAITPTASFTKSSQLFAVLDNVFIVQDHCNNNVGVNLYFSGTAPRTEPANSDLTCYGCDRKSTKICSVVPPSASDDPPSGECYTIVDACLINAQSAPYYFTAVIVLNGGSDTDLKYHDTQIAFDLKFFYQNPFTVTSSSSSSTFVNVSHVKGGAQQILIPNANTGVGSSTAHFVELVFEDITLMSGTAFPNLMVFLTPSGGLSPGDNYCLDSSCFEVRGGTPITNSEYFPLTAGDYETFWTAPSFSFQCTGSNDAGFLAGADACTVTIMPCASNATNWIVRTYFADTNGAMSPTNLPSADDDTRVGDEYLWPFYVFSWSTYDLTSADVTQFPDAMLQTRSIFAAGETHTGFENAERNPPGAPEVYADLNFFQLDGMDDYRIFQITIPEAQRETHQLQIQTWVVGSGVQSITFTPNIPITSPVVSWIGSGSRPPFPAMTSPTTLDTCADCANVLYFCNTAAGCNTAADTFTIDSSCDLDSTYWVVFRSLSVGYNGVQVSARLVAQNNSGVERVLASDLFVGTSSPTYQQYETGDVWEVLIQTSSDNAVEPQNYHHYFVTFTEEDIANRAWIFNFSTSNGIDSTEFATDDTSNVSPPASLTHDLWLLVRKGDSPLDYWTYSISILMSADNAVRSVIEIPACDLSAGTWYFSVFNPAWYSHAAVGLNNPSYDSSDQYDSNYYYAGYHLFSFLKPVGFDSENMILDSTNPFSETRVLNGDGSLVSAPVGVYTHLGFEITPEALAAGSNCVGGTGIGCYFEKYLSIKLEMYTPDTESGSDGPWISTSDIKVGLTLPQVSDFFDSDFFTETARSFDRGHPLSIDPKIGNYQPLDFQSGSCLDEQADFVEIVSDSEVYEVILTPCNVPYKAGTNGVLVPGQYYLTVLSSTHFRVNFTIDLVTLPFSRVTSSNAGNTWTATRGFQVDSTDLARYEYYTIVVGADKITPNSYLQFNVTDILGCPGAATQSNCVAPTTFAVDIYQETCLPDKGYRYHQDAANFVTYRINPANADASAIPLNAYKSLVFDYYVGLAPCSVRAGVYYIRVSNPQNAQYTLSATLFEPAVYTYAEARVPHYITSQVYQYEWQIYKYDVPSSAYGLVADIYDVSCGTVQMFAKFGSPAGPGSPTGPSSATGYQDTDCASCYAAYCETTSTAHEDHCAIFLDSCELPRGGALTTWYFTVHGLVQDNFVVNDPAFAFAPITYTLDISHWSFNVRNPDPVGCYATLDFYDSLPCNSAVPTSADLITNSPPQQFVFQFDAMSTFSYPVLSHRSADSSDRQIIVRRNSTVPFAWDVTNTADKAFWPQQVCASTATGSLDLKITSTNSFDSMIFHLCPGTGNELFFQNNAFGPTELYAWMSATHSDSASIKFDRFDPYVPFAWPGIAYEGTFWRTGSSGFLESLFEAIGAHYYAFPDDINAVYFSSRFQWSQTTDNCVVTAYYAQSHAWNSDQQRPGLYFCSDILVKECDPLFKQFTYLKVTPDSSNDACCSARPYSFSYSLTATVTTISIDNVTHIWESCEPETGSSGRHYELDLPSTPQTYLRFTIDRYPGNSPSDVTLRIRDEHVAIPTCADPVSPWTNTCDSSSPLIFDYLCSYNDLFFSVYLVNSAEFNIKVEQISAVPHAVSLDTVTNINFDGLYYDDGKKYNRAFVSFTTTLPLLDLVVTLECIDFPTPDTPSLSYSLGGSDYFPAPNCGYSNCNASGVHLLTVLSDKCSAFSILIHLPARTPTVIPLGQDSTFIFAEQTRSYYTFDVPSTAWDATRGDFILVEINNVHADALLAAISYQLPAAPACGTIDLSQIYSSFSKPTNAAALSDVYFKNYLYPNDATIDVSGGRPITGNSMYDSIVIQPDGSVTTNNGVLVIPPCLMKSGTYHLTIIPTGSCKGGDVHFTLTPKVVHLLPTAALSLAQTATTPISGILSFNWERATSTDFYFFPVLNASLTDRWGQVRLADVRGGALRMWVTKHSIPYHNTDYYNSNYLSPYNYKTNEFKRTTQSPAGLCNPVEYSCTTTDTCPEFSSLNNLGASCAVAIEPCVWSGDNWYVMVYQNTQYDNQRFTSYNLFAESAEYTLIAPGASQSKQFSLDASAGLWSVPKEGNWQHFFYQISTDSVSSVSIHVEMDATFQTGSGAYVSIYDSLCASNSVMWSNSYCSSELDSWVCDFEVTTRADHISTNYYIDVYGYQGGFTISYTSGADNCLAPEVVNPQIDFCAGFIDYPTWDVVDIAALDSAASCFYDELLSSFLYPVCSQECQFGVSDPCDLALRRFACYQKFRPCDEDGFITSTCSKSCAFVEQVCARTFVSSGLSFFDCASPQYIDADEDSSCAGSSLSLDVSADSDFDIYNLKSLIAADSDIRGSVEDQ